MSESMGVKARLLKAAQLKSVVVDLGDGLKVIVREMTSKQRDEWEQSLIDDKGRVNTNNASARLLSYCLVDEEGELMFSDPEEIGALGSSVTKPLIEAARRLNLLSPEDFAAAEGN